MAERVGFEPTVRFPARSLSRRVLSTAQPPLRVCRILPELLEAGLKSGAYTRCAVVSAFHRNRGLRGAAIIGAALPLTSGREERLQQLNGFLRQHARVKGQLMIQRWIRQ